MSDAPTTLRRRSLPPAPSRRRAVRVVFGPDPEARARPLPLDGEAYVVGRRGRGLGLVADPHLSREHFELRVDPGLRGYVIQDLGSSNGTFVDGARLEAPVALATGQVIAAGESLFVVDEEPAAGALPPARSRTPRPVPEVAGASFFAERLRQAVATVGPAGGTVLLLGETGTGKEVVAHALHRASDRRGELVAVNAAAIPAELLEAELFGVRKGAFTGAEVDRAGLFARAAQGTLFLDEIGDMPVALQAKLLRVLEDGLVQPLGGGPAVPVDVRVVAATQVDLEKTGFRRDLEARLGDFVFHLPPLRERRADVLELFEHFTRGEPGRRAVAVELAEALLLDPLPHNARTLRQLARRLLALDVEATTWDLELLPESMQRPIRARATTARDAPSQAELEAALLASGGVVIRAAEALGCDRKSIYRWMRRYGMSAEKYR